MADEKKEKKEQFVGPYKIKKIISINAMELKLPESIKIHLVSMMAMYKAGRGRVYSIKI